MAAEWIECCLLHGLRTPAPWEQLTPPLTLARALSLSLGISLSLSVSVLISVLYRNDITNGLSQQGSPQSPLHLLQSGDPPPPSMEREIFGESAHGSTLEATQWQILSQYPTDATRFWWNLYGS